MQNSSLAPKLSQYELCARDKWSGFKDRLDEPDIRIALHLSWLICTILALLYCILIPERFLSISFMRLVCCYLSFFCLKCIYLRTKSLIRTGSTMTTTSSKKSKRHKRNKSNENIV